MTLKMSQTNIFRYTPRCYFIKSQPNLPQYFNSSSKVVTRFSSTKASKQKTASSMYRTMDIFDRETKIKQREISAQQKDYHLCEYVKEEVGWRTADRVFDIKRTFKNAVELGKAYLSRILESFNQHTIHAFSFRGRQRSDPFTCCNLDTHLSPHQHPSILLLYTLVGKGFLKIP